MKTEVEQLEKNEVLLKVEVPAEDFGKAVDQAFRRVSQKVTVPGFRKGKVPRTIVEQRVGKGYIIEEAIQGSLPYYYNEAVNKSGIEPIDEPKVDIEQANEGLPLVFKVKVQVKPEVKLGEYEGIEVERPFDKVTDEELDRQLRKVQDSFATLEEAPENQVEKGIYVLMDFNGTVDDEPVEGGSATDYLLEIGSGAFVPGVEDQLIGMAKGEEKEIWVDIPEDYHAEQIAGKRVKFDVTIKDIKRKKLPEIDDELAKGMGFDSLDEYKEDLRKKLQAIKEGGADAAVRNAILKKVTDAAELEIPPVMIERKLDELIADFAGSLQSRGATLEEYLKISDKSLEDLRETLRDESEFQVKSSLVLEAISREENIGLEDAEIDQEIKQLADALGRDFDETKRTLIANGRIGYLVERIMTRKTIDRLMEKANVKTQDKPKAQKAKTNEAGKKPAKKGKVQKAGEKTEGKPAESERDEV